MRLVIAHLTKNTETRWGGKRHPFLRTKHHVNFHHRLGDKYCNGEKRARCNDCPLWSASTSGIAHQFPDFASPKVGPPFLNTRECLAGQQREWCAEPHVRTACVGAHYEPVCATKRNGFLSLRRLPTSAKKKKTKKLRVRARLA